ncbi:MAG: hypothetical protein QM714_11460 [Nocardioides sp.]|uniref:hypothetical protein n=1 Tax=Nocardioides sp. TaxID=35761 RepID=UPI0039E28ADB
MTQLEEQLRELGRDLTLDHPVADIIVRGQVIRHKRRLQIISGAVAAGIVLAVATAGLSAIASRSSQVLSSGVPSGTKPGWSAQAIGLTPGELRTTNKICRSSREGEPLRSTPIAATALGSGASLLLYHEDGLLWTCETTGHAGGTGAGPWPSTPVNNEIPLADLCSTTLTVAQVLGTPVGSHTRYPGYHLVWGRAAAQVSGVVVTADGRSRSAGMADGLYFALVPSREGVDLNARTTPTPTVTAIAYSDSGTVLGHDKQAC